MCCSKLKHKLEILFEKSCEYTAMICLSLGTFYSINNNSTVLEQPIIIIIMIVT